MTEHGFISVFSNYMESFLELRHRQGYSIKRYLPFIRNFDKFCADSNYNTLKITEELYSQWLASLDYLGNHTRYSRVVELRMFAYYLTKLGILCYIPRLPKLNPVRYVPYIYTSDEIERIFKSSEKTIMQSEWRSTILVLPSLIRLLYSTGMRMGEALSIRNRDVNFDRHVITLYHTKNGRERLAPINPSMEKVLKQYISYRNRLPITDVSAPWNYLFVSMKGTQIKKNSLEYHFKKILEDADVVDLYNSKLPRIHDLRHTACVHAMHKILSQGKDLYCHLPILSTFMGHTGIVDTEYYLRLAQQHYPDLIGLQVSVMEPILGMINRKLIIKSEDDV